MTKAKVVTWNCPLCSFEKPDDGSVGDAQCMSDHIAEHEREQEAAFQQWLADGMPGTGAELRAAFRALLFTRALTTREVMAQ
jgi:hypothetical protein